MYIHERDNWTNFRWDESQVSLLQEVVCRKQGMFYGRLSSLGFDSKSKDTAIRDIQDLLDKTSWWRTSLEQSVQAIQSSMMQKTSLSSSLM
ncbi:DUF4172 domain-containing protein [Parabacteroides distasonis]|nr:DUF4172 domain-containing protein [Parabacteroides distasonis]